MRQMTARIIQKFAASHGLTRIRPIKRFYNGLSNTDKYWFKTFPEDFLKDRIKNNS